MPRPIRPPRFDVAENGFYYAYFYDAGKRRTQRESLGTKSPVEAQARFAVWLTHVAPTTIEAPTVADVIDVYLAGVVEPHIVSKAPIRNALSHAREGLGQHLADALTPSIVNAYIKAKLETYAKGSVRNHVAQLRAAYVYARKEEVISCPPPIYDAPDQSDRRERWMTEDEIERLFAAGAAYRAGLGLTALLPAEIYAHLGLRTAARSAAMKGLTWDRVDLKRQMVDYRSPEWLALPKKRRSKRRAQVPISNKLMPVIDRAHAERVDAFVIPRIAGRSVEWDFPRILAAAKLADVTPHIMRHTWATHASMNGVPMADIARVMAITVQMAETVYAKFAPEYLRNAVNF